MRSKEVEEAIEHTRKEFIGDWRRKQQRIDRNAFQIYVDKEDIDKIETLLNYIEELEKEIETSNTQNAMMSQRHFNDSRKIKEQDKAMTYILQDLEVEKKGYSIEEMKKAYMVRAKSNGIFIKNTED